MYTPRDRAMARLESFFPVSGSTLGSFAPASFEAPPKPRVRRPNIDPGWTSPPRRAHLSWAWRAPSPRRNAPWMDARTPCTPWRRAPRKRPPGARGSRARDEMGETRRARSRHGGLSVRAEMPPRCVNSSRSRRRRSPTARVVVTGRGEASATEEGPISTTAFAFTDATRNTSLLAGIVGVTTENSTTRPAQRGASAGRAAADAARRPVRVMSWLVDAAKSAADKAEAALQKLDKDGGEVVVAAKKELFASSDEPAVPAPPPQQLSRRQTGSRAPAPRRDRVDSKPLGYAASPEPATVSSPPEATTQRRADDASLVDVSSSGAVPGAAKKKTGTAKTESGRSHGRRRNTLPSQTLRTLAWRAVSRSSTTSPRSSRGETRRRAKRSAMPPPRASARRRRGGDESARRPRRGRRRRRRRATSRAPRRARRRAGLRGRARLAELAGVGGERARRLGAEQRALAFATRRRDDAADAVAAAERRVAAARDAEERRATRGARVSADASDASEASAHLASVALIETNLRATRAAAEACRRRPRRVRLRRPRRPRRLSRLSRLVPATTPRRTSRQKIAARSRVGFGASRTRSSRSRAVARL